MPSTLSRLFFALLTAFVLLTVVGGCDKASSMLFVRGALAADPFCNITMFPREADMRALNRGIVRIAVTGSALASSAPPNATVMIALNSTTGLIVPQAVVLVTDYDEVFIQINLQRLISYDIFEDDNVTFSLPPALFGAGQTTIGCPNMHFAIHPSSGTIDLSPLPLTVTEVDINENGVAFPLVVSYDDFLSADVNWTVSSLEPGFRIEFTLRGAAPSNTIDVLIVRNETFNINRSAEIVLTMSFPRSLMRSGQLPILGDEIYGYESIELPIQGSKPFITSIYSKGLSGIAGEDMWDGTASVTLKLSGDVFSDNMLDYWNNRTHGPIFEVERPIQPNGFTMFLGNGNWPIAVINRRTIVLNFTGTVGFAFISSPVESVDVSNIEEMIAEKMATPCAGGCLGDDCFCANFRILKANSSSVRANFISPAFNTPSLTESDIRRTGVNITIELIYDIFTAQSVATAYTLFPGIATMTLSVGGLQARLVRNNTRLILTIPPQPDYNIAEGTNEVVRMRITDAMSATQAILAEAQRSRSFTIRSVVTPVCRRQLLNVVDGAITETDIRERDVNMTISVIGDTFCLDSSMGDPLNSSAVRRFTDRIFPRTIQYVVSSYTASALTITLKRNYSFDIKVMTMAAFPVPAEIMCSMETCRADPAPVGDYTPNTLTVPIWHAAGYVIATFPTVNETYLRTEDLTVAVELWGESFGQGIFTPLWQLSTRDPLRGFGGTISSGCNGVRDSSNYSRATIVCRSNSRYDISANETARIVIDVSSVASEYAPMSNMVIPLRETPVVGTVIAADQYRLVELTEEDMVNGGARFVISLQYERFNATQLSAALIGSIAVNGTVDSMGVKGSAQYIFANGGLQLNDDEDQLVLTFQPAPSYDITANETFMFSITAKAVASGMAPYQANFTVKVSVSPGRFVVYGTAAFASARQVLEENLVLHVRLYNDMWLTAADFITKEMCTLEKMDYPKCTVTIDPDSHNRILDIRLDSSETFSLYTNTTFLVGMKTNYIRSGLIPPQIVSMFVYVSAGRITWSGPTVVTEDTVRSGEMAPIYLKVGGDSLADVRSVRASLVASVTCSGSNDRYGFCGRAEYLFGDKFTLSDNRRDLSIKLQANEDFDVTQVQNVTLRLSGQGLVSRFSPNLNESFTFRIVPTAGKFFMSGFSDSITERDISGVTRKTIQFVLTLYGERWLNNKSKVIPILVGAITSDAASHETNGFMRYKSQIITADGTTLSDSGRVLTVQFTAVEAFDIYYDEKVTINVGRECVLSNMLPTLSSSTNAFTIQATGGLITMSPTLITANVLRSEGVLLTLSVDGDQWKTEVVQDPVALLEAIRVGSSPQQEPSGFAVNLDVAVGDIRTRGSSINGTSLIITLLPMPLYSIINAETITLFLRQGWTTSGFPLVPNEFTLTVAPVYDYIEVVLDLEDYFVLDEDGHPTNETGFVLSDWIAEVASALSVAPASIVIDYYGDEVLLPGGANPYRYRRVRFRVKNEDTSTAAPFDNRAAANFISYSDAFLLTRLSAIKTFFNSTPPDDSFWLTLKPAEEVKGAFLIPINKNIVWVFAGLIVLALLGVGGLYYYRRKRIVGGVSRAKEVDRATRRKAAIQEAEATEERKFDRAAYSGQGGSSGGLDEMTEGLLEAPVLREASPTRKGGDGGGFSNEAAC